MSSEIEQMNFEKIINKIGIPAILTDYVCAYKENANKKEITNFEQEISQYSNGQKKFKDFAQLILKYENIFDKERYLFHVARLLENDYRNNFLQNQKSKSVFSLVNYDKDLIRLEALIASLKKILSEISILDLSFKNDKKGNSTEWFLDTDFFVISEKKRKEKKKHLDELIKKIDENIGINKIFAVITVDDFDTIIKYSNLSKYLKNKYLEKIKNSQDKLKNFEILKELILSYVEYINIDKLLNLALMAFYNINNNNFQNFTYEEVLKLEDYLNYINKSLNDKNASIIGKINFAGEVDISILEIAIRNLKNHFLNRKYYTENEIEEISQKMLNGESSLYIYSKEEFEQVFRFSGSELIQLLANNKDAINYFIANEIFTVDEIKCQVLEFDKIEMNTLWACIKSNILSLEEIIELYNNKKIKIKDIIEVSKSFEKYQFYEKLTSPKRLMELYIFDKDSKEFIQYKNIFKAILIDGKSLKKQKQVANEVLNFAEDLLDNDKIIELYHIGIIPIESLIEFTGKEYILNSYLEFKIKPQDTKRLLNENIITIEELGQVLKNSKKKYEEKIVFIYSIFNDNKENYDKLLKIVTQDDSENPNELKGLLEKLDFIYENDDTTDYEVLQDGNIIFYMPNEEKYIIEKGFCNSAQKKSIYGTATYIINENDFCKNRDLIIEDKKINNIEINKLVSNNDSNIIKIVYSEKTNEKFTTWKKSITGFLGKTETQNQSKYTDDQKNNINKILENINL